MVGHMNFIQWYRNCTDMTVILAEPGVFREDTENSSPLSKERWKIGSLIIQTALIIFGLVIWRKRVIVQSGERVGIKLKGAYAVGMSLLSLGVGAGTGALIGAERALFGTYGTLGGLGVGVVVAVGYFIYNYFREIEIQRLHYGTTLTRLNSAGSIVEHPGEVD